MDVRRRRAAITITLLRPGRRKACRVFESITWGRGNGSRTESDSPVQPVFSATTRGGRPTVINQEQPSSCFASPSTSAAAPDRHRPQAQARTSHPSGNLAETLVGWCAASLTGTKYKRATYREIASLGTSPRAVENEAGSASRAAVTGNHKRSSPQQVLGSYKQNSPPRPQAAAAPSGSAPFSEKSGAPSAARY